MCSVPYSDTDISNTVQTERTTAAAFNSSFIIDNQTSSLIYYLKPIEKQARMIWKNPAMGEPQQNSFDRSSRDQFYDVAEPCNWTWWKGYKTNRTINGNHRWHDGMQKRCLTDNCNLKTYNNITNPLRILIFNIDVRNRIRTNIYMLEQQVKWRGPNYVYSRLRT